jgi:thiol-disulfide isomerase/thioredoxin
MNQRNVAIASIALLVVVVAGAAVWFSTHRQAAVQVQNASQAPATAAPIVIGSKAPEFQASTTAGPFDLAKATKPVFLEVFATWCPHCQRETQVLNKLFALYGKQIAFVAVSGSDTGMDGSSPASQADVMNFAQRFSVQYPIAYDGSGAVGADYLQGGFPTIVIIRKDKTVAYANSGEIAYDDLAAEIGKVLK